MKKLLLTYETWRPGGPTGKEDIFGTAELARDNGRYFTKQLSERGLTIRQPRWREISVGEARAILEGQQARAILEGHR